MAAAQPMPPASRIEAEVRRARSLVEKRQFAEALALAQALLPEVRAWIAEHKRLKQLLHEIHQLSLALVRTHARHRRRKAGRP